VSDGAPSRSIQANRQRGSDPGVLTETPDPGEDRSGARRRPPGTPEGPTDAGRTASLGIDL